MDFVTETATKVSNVILENKHLSAYYIGILYILISHSLMLIKGTPNMYWHSIFSIVAVVLIANYFMDKKFYGKEAEVVLPPVVAPVPAPVVAPVVAPVSTPAL